LSIDLQALAGELAGAYAARRIIPTPPSAREDAFDIGSAYAVEAELVRLRTSAGARTAGRKVGFANRALWRKFKLDTVLWAHMYDDSVRYAGAGAATLGLGAMIAPKIEPEIIFRLSRAPSGNLADPAEALAAVEWMALGCGIVDCVYQDWKFQPADFVAAYGLHAALIVGEPMRMQPGMISSIAESLAIVRVRLLKDHAVIAEGSGAKVLGSPALCLGELAAGIAREPAADPLASGELIATGALTDNQFIAPGETWTASLDGIDLPDLTLRTTA
jgi:2-oxo-3-hexenedioate decarboxylase